ncbi:MAG: hypothetical protein QOD44_3447, partial [Solirubrobacteraceae bacterium]|nr:hypothetical protein [Solirubrobacteraceae bacterium]
MVTIDTAPARASGAACRPASDMRTGAHTDVPSPASAIPPSAAP